MLFLQLLYCNQISTEENLLVDPREFFESFKNINYYWERAFWVALVNLQTSTDLSKIFLKNVKEISMESQGRSEKGRKSVEEPSLPSLDTSYVWTYFLLLSFIQAVHSFIQSKKLDFRSHHFKVLLSEWCKVLLISPLFIYSGFL